MAVEITVQKQVSTRFGRGQMTLHDLETLVEEAKKMGLSGSARVNINHFQGDQRDPSYSTITVSA